MISTMRNQDWELKEDLIPPLYAELRELASHLLRSERENHTLQKTALVHETFLRLVGKRIQKEPTPRTLLAVAAHQMRQILVDHARRKNAEKRGAGQSQMPLQGEIASYGGPNGADGILAIHEALEKLGASDPRALAVVELKFFAGFTNSETAAILEVSDATVESTWTYARLWLFRELRNTKATGLSGPKKMSQSA